MISLMHVRRGYESETRGFTVFVAGANRSAQLQLDDAWQTKLQNCASKRFELGEDRVQIKGETEISSYLFFSY